MSTLKLTGLGALLFLLVACGQQTKQQTTQAKVYTVAAKPLHQVLHFNGTVQPIRETSVISPLEAVVETMNFHYGQMVKKGDVVLTLISSELQKQYNDSLTDYLKAKDNYTIAQAKFVGTQDLWSSGLLSKNNYLSEKSSVDTARVTFMQETRKLTELLEKMDEHNSLNVNELKLADFNKIKSILTTNHNLIRLKAAGDGVMLYPPKSGEDKATRINVGSAVKSGQVLALIGDLKGISVEIDVPEVDIDKIRPGMEAEISGIAFGKHQLKGHLVAVNAQASNANGAGLPSFTAVVEVSNLSADERQWIKVGMSAAIELKLDNQEQLFIPIAAVSRERGASIVQVKAASGAVEKRVITTGPVQADEVVIETGLKAGDVLVYG